MGLSPPKEIVTQLIINNEYVIDVDYAKVFIHDFFNLRNCLAKCQTFCPLLDMWVKLIDCLDHCLNVIVL